FILGSVGIALALFGTILVYLAAEQHLGEGMTAMAWDHLVRRSAAFDPALLNLAFVFLLLGYGTKVGLAPVHAWLPDAHAEGPTPISAVLSGLLLNVALFALLRFKLIMAGNAQVLSPGPMMVTMGLVSLLVVAVAAIAGLPPFGVFTSEFLLVTSTFARAPWLAALLGAGLMIAFSALALRLHGLAFGDSPRRHTLHAWRLAPMALHL